MFRPMIIFALLLVVSCVAPPKKTAVSGDYVAEAPKFKVGDRWKYIVKRSGDTFEKSVIGVKENGDFTIKITHNDMATLYVDFDRNHKKIADKGVAPKLAYWKTHSFIDYPLYVGKTYSRTISKYSGRGFNLAEIDADFKVTRLSREEIDGSDVHVFTISYSYPSYNYHGPKSNSGEIRYSPELKAVVTGDSGLQLFAYQVISDPLQKVMGDGRLAAQTGHGGSPLGILSFGYENHPGNEEALSQLRKELVAERERWAQEKRETEALLKQQRSEADALKAEHLAAAEKLKAQKLAEADQLAKDKIAVAEAEAEKMSQAVLAEAEAKARKLLAEQQEQVRLEKQRQQAEEQSRRLATKKQLAEDNRYGVAVIIGNRNYSKNNPDVPDVDFAHNDAEAMYRYVKDTLGYQEGNIIYIKDATQAALTSVFGNERTHRGKLFNWSEADKSKLFVYYSGHGAPGLSDGSGYLLPVNADPAAVELNGYPLSTLYQNLSKIPARQVTVVLDACFSGSSANGNLVKNASSIALRRVEDNAVLEKGAVLTAAAVSEVASWDKQRKLGLFTAQFLEGVSGAADRDEFGDGNGQVSLGELKRYLSARVSYQARRHYYRDQNPQVSGDENLVLGYPDGEI